MAGIKAAGKNFTRESVISSINKMTNWTANGLRPKINWTTAHGLAAPGDQSCYGYVQVENGKFVPQFKTTSQQPFVCFGVNPYPATLTNPTLTAATP